jgi:hypothetical protein
MLCYHSFNPIFFLILLLCFFTYTLVTPTIVFSKTEEKRKRREQKRQCQEEKGERDRLQDERYNDRDRRISQLEKEEKTYWGITTKIILFISVIIYVIIYVTISNKKQGSQVL